MNYFITRSRVRDIVSRTDLKNENIKDWKNISNKSREIMILSSYLLSL